MLTKDGHSWEDSLTYPWMFVYSMLGCFGFVLCFKGIANYKATVIVCSCKGAIGIIGLHPFLIQYLRRSILLFHGQWGNFSLTETFLISVIIMGICMLIIPFINNKFPILIGLKKRKI